MPCFPVSWIWDGLTKEVWEPKNWCFWTVVLEKTLRVPWTARSSNQSILKEIILGFLWKEWCLSWNSSTFPPHVRSWLIGKDSDAGRDWGQEEKGMTEDEMAGWHHWLDECESEWTPGDGDGQGGLACCASWCHKESDTTEWLNWTELIAEWAHSHHLKLIRVFIARIYCTLKSVAFF